MGDDASFLFANPSFVEGLARLLDFGDTLTEYNTSPTGDEADARAVEADWNAVGGDLREALQWLSDVEKSKGTRETAARIDP